VGDPFHASATGHKSIIYFFIYPFGKVRERHEKQ
jgi:hypothetical protein